MADVIMPTSEAEAFRRFGALRCWTNPGETVDGLGITLGHGSWPVYDAAAVIDPAPRQRTDPGRDSGHTRPHRVRRRCRVALR